MSTPIRSERGRGTPGYRAPELLEEETPHFSTRSDIWALGCILHELNTGQRLFSNDWQVSRYATGLGELSLTLPYDSESNFWQHHVAETVLELLHKDPKQRPNALEIYQIISAYCQLIEFTGSVAAPNWQSYPSHSEWKAIVGSATGRIALLFELSKWHFRQGSDALQLSLLRWIVYREDVDSKSGDAFLDRKLWEDIAASLTKACSFYDAALVHSRLSTGADQSIQVDKEQGEEMEEWKFRRTRSTLAILNREYAKALIEYHASLTTHPDFVSWKRTFDRIFLDDGIDQALLSCAARLNEFPSDVTALGILLSNLLVLKGMQREGHAAQGQALAGARSRLIPSLFPSSHEYFLESIRAHQKWYFNVYLLWI
jgi:serine/threonine protein kinase